MPLLPPAAAAAADADAYMMMLSPGCRHDVIDYFTRCRH